MQLAPDLGHEVREERLDICGILNQIETGQIVEVFGCGTAAVILPIGMLAYRGREHVINRNEVVPVARRLYDELTGLQHGRIEDRYNWLVPVQIKKQTSSMLLKGKK